MTDIRADEPTPLDDGERLPWLEAVEDDEDGDGPSTAKLIAFVVIGLVAIGLIVGGLFWMGNRSGTGPAAGEPELIAAPKGDYKIPPGEPGGMKVEGEGDTAFAASEGADPKGNINVDAVPEEPLLKAPPPTNAPAAAPKQAPAAAAPAPKAAPAAPAAAGGATIQLGAFSSQAGANNAWKALAARFGYLAPLSHSVTATASGGKTLYRLRASGPDAKTLCGRLRVAGESCVAVD
ncbi:MAG TPA: SPOR domain-containing protein [Allosphingosinicella sp.]|nr:SPOR domain-containing protein [Allosphingosinicella sp.]